ncbi:MAG: CPXCG motif-containing cysteine-rich protein [Thiohalocapsa sp.]|nr:CPXCG motif-containing cysteine-rich protein [Thiohalocapsa sp.]MCF7993142.1 CPXCG motif-containing cysteine-rich protein [Thiohalocapsa sp.]
MYETVTTECPWCGAPTEVSADCSAGSQIFVEDCMVCCSPMLIRLECDPLTDGVAALTAVRENE